MKPFFGLLAICCAAFTIGCEKAAPSLESEKAERTAKIKELHREYVERLYTEVLPKLDQMSDKEAERLIEDKAMGLLQEIFGLHQELLRQRAHDTLAALNEIPQVDETQYFVLASETYESSNDMINKPSSGGGDKLPPIITELWQYNVFSRANLAISPLMYRTMGRDSDILRRLLDGFARPVWEIADRDTDYPRLVKRMGPEIIVVDLRPSENGYDIAAVRWLRHKSLPKPNRHEPAPQPPASDKDKRIPKG